MKKLIFLFALAFASAGWAQAPAPQEAAKAEPARTAPAKTQAKKAKTAKVAKKHRRAEDARHCLQRGDNNAIIKCAEEYL
ncbi:MAG TPA: hypothetical protein VJT77_12310 [Burkholderiales bacterium]|nr:hypothetical protein [Burkholderiales bacterium]